MSNDVGAILAFGLLFGKGGIDDGLVPWEPEEGYSGDFDGWWREVNSFVNPAGPPYTENGGYKEGLNSLSPQVANYWAETKRWDKANPCPVTVIGWGGTGVGYSGVLVRGRGSYDLDTMQSPYNFHSEHSFEEAAKLTESRAAEDEVLRKFWSTYCGELLQNPSFHLIGYCC